jgi:hypothetical protein
MIVRFIILSVYIRGRDARQLNYDVIQRRALNFLIRTT